MRIPPKNDINELPKGNPARRERNNLTRPVQLSPGREQIGQ